MSLSATSWGTTRKLENLGPDVVANPQTPPPTRTVYILSKVV
jgi:hypothetical protein